MMLGSSFFLGLKGPLLGAAIWAAYKYYSHGVAPKELATILYIVYSRGSVQPRPVSSCAEGSMQ